MSNAITRPKKPKAPVTLALTAEERGIVYGIGYYAVLDPAFTDAALDREPDDGITEAVAHLRAVMDLYDQIGWEREDDRAEFKIEAPWLFLMKAFGAIERDLANSLGASLRGLRWSSCEFSWDEGHQGSIRELRELGVISNLIRRIGGRWQGLAKNKRGFSKEWDMHRVVVERFGEGCGLVYDRIRSEQPLLTFDQLFDLACQEWAKAIEGEAA